MGALLGLGLSHFPPLCQQRRGPVRRLALDPRGPRVARRSCGTPAGWPEEMRKEWGDDEGLAAAARHRAEMVDGLRRVRVALDEFAPDAVVVVGDDQFENFREDVIPPFTILAYEDRKVRPGSPAEATRGVMPKDNTGARGRRHHLRGPVPPRYRPGPDLREPSAGDIDVAYAYEPLHHPGLPHAFMNTVLFLDYDRKGFDHPIVPLALNCYGRRVVSRKGGLSRLGDAPPFDPPSPRPGRVFDLGAALGPGPSSIRRGESP